MDMNAKSCSVSRMWKTLSALALIATSAAAQDHPTAYDALRVVGTQLSRDYVNRVISMRGIDGNPQPDRWTILLADRRAPGGIREVEVTNGRITAQRTPTQRVIGSTAAATIETSKLNLDSSGAYQVAAHTADQSHTVFSVVSYTLRTDDRRNPTWVVTLQDQASRPVGTIQIGANKGSVTRVEGMYRGTNMLNVETDGSAVRDVGRDRDREANYDQNQDRDEVRDHEGEEDEADENIVKREIKRAFRRTRDDAQRMFEGVQRSFDHFFYRD